MERFQVERRMSARVLLASLGALAFSEAAAAADRTPVVAVHPAPRIQHAHRVSPQIVSGSSRVFAFAPEGLGSLPLPSVIASPRPPIGFIYSEPGWPLSIGPRY
jgi:hypothetical protein